MGTNLKDQTHLVKRGPIYYHRLRVPAALRQHYGKDELVVSLRTREKAEALRLARLRTLQLDQEFAHILAMQSTGPATDLTREEVDRMAALYYAHILGEDDEARTEAAAEGGLSDRKWENRAHSLDVVAAAEAFDAGRSRLGDTFEEEDFAGSYGLKVAKDSPSFVPLMMAMKAAYRKALEALKMRHEGAVVETPVVEAGIIRGELIGKGMTFTALREYWQTQKAPRPRTIMEVQSIVTWLAELKPGLLASKMTKADVVSFKDDQLAKGKAPATVRKYLGLLRGLFSVAVENDKLPLNPTTGVKVHLPKVTKKARLPFSVDDLSALFASRVFTQGTRPVGGRGEASFWLPLISLFSGARLSEIGQLMTTDIQLERGVHVFYFTTDTDDEQTQKSEVSRRWVPVHPMLVKCGLLDYWESVKESGGGQLFPLLERTRQGNITATWSQWFGRYLRDVVKIKDPRKVFHSFRHGFKDACRDSDIQLQVHDALTGHGSATPNSGEGYGGAFYPLSPLISAMERLQYDGLDLSHLHKNRG